MWNLCFIFSKSFQIILYNDSRSHYHEVDRSISSSKKQVQGLVLSKIKSYEHYRFRRSRVREDVTLNKSKYTPNVPKLWLSVCKNFGLTPDVCLENETWDELKVWVRQTLELPIKGWCRPPTEQLMVIVCPVVHGTDERTTGTQTKMSVSRRERGHGTGHQVKRNVETQETD